MQVSRIKQIKNDALATRKNLKRRNSTDITLPVAGIISYCDDMIDMCNTIVRVHAILHDEAMDKAEQFETENKKLRCAVKKAIDGRSTPPKFHTNPLHLQIKGVEDAYLFGWEAAMLECSETLSKALEGDKNETNTD
jgi:hypothetical protein